MCFHAVECLLAKLVTGLPLVLITRFSYKRRVNIKSIMEYNGYVGGHNDIIALTVSPESTGKKI